MTDRERVLAGLPSATRDRLTVYAALLVRWQATINLVAPSTLPALWTRHIGDSLQVRDAAPLARQWVDLGSGGGFPGLVTAILLADVPNAAVHLIESDKRKAAFLRAVSRETGAPAVIHAERIEMFVPNYHEHVDAVSARALAPLARIVEYAERFLLDGAVGVFPRGETAQAELTALTLDRKFRVESVPSRTHHQAALLIVRAEPTGRSRTAGGV